MSTEGDDKKNPADNAKKDEATGTAKAIAQAVAASVKEEKSSVDKWNNE